MSSSRLHFDGLDDLRASLRKLPAEMRGDAEQIVFDCAKGAADEIRSEYPRKTGELADKVEVQQLSGGQAFAGSVVQNKSKLAFIFENGTQLRHNAKGANRGQMPPAHVFIPAMIRWRKLMYSRLRDMMQSKGLRVTGG